MEITDSDAESAVQLAKELVKEVRRLKKINNTLLAACESAKQAHLDLIRDIRQWVQLAKYQRERAPDSTVPIPRADAIAVSEQLLDAVCETYRTIDAAIAAAKESG